MIGCWLLAIGCWQWQILELIKERSENETKIKTTAVGFGIRQICQ
jgi:hypothetical protein